MTKIPLYLLFVFLLLSAIYLFICMLLPDHTKIWLTPFYSQPLSAPMVGLVGSVGAVAGWINSAYVSRRSSIKQHTMSLLTQSRLSSEMGNHLRAVSEVYPSGKIVLYDEVIAAKQSEPWIRGARYLLNYYEFMAVAMNYGDLYKPMVQDCVRGLFISAFKQLEAVVEHAVKSDQNPSAKGHLGH